ncbi:MAG: CPXCG motif-containing cysteine-rich protein [Steroidobacteraceae bacterium]
MAKRKVNSPVDELYGLEPVIEPGDGEGVCDPTGKLQSRTVRCPYCGEAFETLVDLSSGSMSYIEDCQVCCRPIEFNLEIEGAGPLARLQVGRSD